MIEENLTLKINCAHYTGDYLTLWDVGLDTIELGIFDHTITYPEESHIILNKESAKKIVEALSDKFDL